MRIGIGGDIHRTVSGRPLKLGGVTIESDMGLFGHSDADVLLHAVIDALLGAAALGDIGRLFPESDPKWKDADSLSMLATVADMLAEAGHTVLNIDATVTCKRPQIAPYAAQMCERIAEACGVSPDQVSVKGKSGNGFGPESTGEAVSAQAAALIS